MPAVAAFDLTPDAHLTRPPDGTPSEWVVAGPRAAFALDGPLPAGWYRLRLHARTPGRPGVRKRADVFADGLRVESFEWNRELREDLIVRLPRPADRLTLALADADGPFHLDRFRLRRVSDARALARAVRLKLRLVSQYQCLWPVLARGGRLLARGQVAEFGRKVLNGLGDSRTMRLEVKRATEGAAVWWRRRALPADRLAALAAEADALPDPPPVAVLIPADPTRTDHARQAVLSVGRQVYRHWQLLVPWPTRRVAAKLAAVVRPDGRSWTFASGRGMAAAVNAAVRATVCSHVLVVPPDWELDEHALLRFAQALPAAGPVACGRPPTAGPTDPTPTLVPVELLRAHPMPAGRDTAAAVVQWAAGLVAGTVPTIREPLVHPCGGAGLLDVSRPPAALGTLSLAGDIRGLTGWDYVTFAVLKGLASAGVTLTRPPEAQVRTELLPPRLAPAKVRRTPADPQLVISPPFALSRFAPDRRTAVLTMWECEGLKPAWVADLNRAAVVIVPTAWGADSFRAAGVTAPVEIAPLGYDPLLYHPTGTTPDRCTFGTAGALSAGGVRKNVGRVVALFRRAFPAEADVRLRVKITPNCPPLDIPPDPRIEVTRAAVTPAALADWYRSLTAYVNASFAEGFGFHLLEAMACGVPLVSTAFSGPTAFFDAGVGYVVPHRLVAADNDIYTGRWADPDDDAMIAAMRRVYADRGEADAFRPAAAARARRFTWRDGGRKLLDALRRHGLVGSPGRGQG